MVGQHNFKTIINNVTAFQKTYPPKNQCTTLTFLLSYSDFFQQNSNFATFEIGVMLVEVEKLLRYL